MLRSCPGRRLESHCTLRCWIGPARLSVVGEHAVRRGLGELYAHRRGIVAIAFGSAMLLLATGCASGTRNAAVIKAGVGPTAAPFTGTKLEPPIHRPAFTFRDTAGRPYDFRRRTSDRTTALFFGYTSCSNVCPTTLAALATAKRGLPLAIAGALTVVFVSVDPIRDTPGKLRRWLDRFDPAFVGLRGSLPVVNRVLDDLKLTHAVAHPEGPPGDSVTHSGVVYLFSPDDQTTVIHTGPVQPTELAEDVTTLTS